jgi:hypothetical protein
MEKFGTFFGHFEYITAIWYNLWPFGTIYGHLVQFMAIWYNLWPFGTIYGHLVILWQFDIFSPVLVYCVEKIWQPWLPRHCGSQRKNATSSKPNKVS